VDHGDRGYASDGLECDAQGRVYLTDYEHNAIHRIPTIQTGEVKTCPGDEVDQGKASAPRRRVVDEVIAQDPRMTVWPDTMSIATDGYLYFTANQLDRQKHLQRRQGPASETVLPVPHQGGRGAVMLKKCS
jgi:sugar lactone lactonase YvrE